MAPLLAIASILAVAVAMGLAACGGGSASEGAADPSPEESALGEPQPWPDLAVRWVEEMMYGDRSLDGAVRARDEAAVEAWIANVASCSAKMPPDPGPLTIEESYEYERWADAGVQPMSPALNGHIEAISLYEIIESACRNYEFAAEHLAASFDPANTYSAGDQVEIGLNALLVTDNDIETVIHQLERVWGKQVSETPGPDADLGQDSDAFDAGDAVGKSLVEDSAADFENGTTTHEELLDACYEARSEHAESGEEVNPVSWGRGCRAGVEDAIAEHEERASSAAPREANSSDSAETTEGALLWQQQQASGNRTEAGWRDLCEYMAADGLGNKEIEAALRLIDQGHGAGYAQARLWYEQAMADWLAGRPFDADPRPSS